MKGNCTAPKTGHHKNPRTRIKCPVCGPGALSRPSSSFGNPASMQPVNWGHVTIREGRSVPGHASWGQVQYAGDIAPGIAYASCSGHSGVKLSSQRNRKIPEPLRSKDGWYEGDVEVEIVNAYFPYEMSADGGGDDWEGRFNSAILSLKNYYPHQWEEVSGEKVELSESRALREEEERRRKTEFALNNPDVFVAKDFSHITLPVPGYSVVKAVSGAGEEKTFMIFKDDIEGAKVVDRPIDDRFVEVGNLSRIGVAREVEAPAVQRGEDIKISFSKLTHKQADKAYYELAKRWRWLDGEVATLEERMRTKGVTHKDFAYGGRKTPHYRIYWDDDNRATYMEVSKAVYDSMVSLPEKMTPGDYKDVESNRASLRADAAIRNWDHVKGQELRDKSRKLREEAEALHKQERRERGEMTPQDRQEAIFEVMCEGAAKRHNIDLPPHNSEAWEYLVKDNPRVLVDGAEPEMVAIAQAMFQGRER